MRIQQFAARATVFCLTLLLPLAAEDDGINWLSSYKEAIQEARRTEKPIFLEYRCEP